jgi:subtilisin family serine protease
VQATGELDVFVVGSVSREALEHAGARVRSEANGVFTAWIPQTAIDAVAALPGVRRIEGAAPMEPLLDVSIPTIGVNAARGAPPLFPGYNGQGVLVGAVDSGVDYDHGDFVDPSGNTRFVGIWDQKRSGRTDAASERHRPLCVRLGLDAGDDPGRHVA